MRVEYSFGQVVASRDRLEDNEAKIQKFRQSKGEAILVMLLGVVNHWITLVLHKDAQSVMNFYLLDSSNIKHLDKEESELIGCVMESRVWKKMRLGLKPMKKFMVKMSVHCLYDQRAFFPKVVNMFREQPTNCQTTEQISLTKIAHNASIGYMLKEYHMYTESVGAPSSALNVQKSTTG